MNQHSQNSHDQVGGGTITNVIAGLFALMCVVGMGLWGYNFFQGSNSELSTILFGIGFIGVLFTFGAGKLADSLF